MLHSKTSPRVPPAETQICPHLGVEDDRQTCLAYPSPWNLCYRSKPALLVRLSHQRRTCLLSFHQSCPVFQNPVTGPLPPELRGQRIVKD